jgi:ribulose-5-phosphate 4-epimerase/fuculose-1-phosphate aldolase
VLDAFDHVSPREPDNPQRSVLARSLAPKAVTEGVILEFDMSSEPLKPFSGLVHSERVMHGAMFRARPDVNAICHHHASAVLPFCLADCDAVNGTLRTSRRVRKNATDGEPLLIVRDRAHSAQNISNEE